MNYTLTLFIIYCVILLAVFFLYERNCRLRKKLISEQKAKAYLLRDNKRQGESIAAYQQQETDLRSVIRFQEGVIQNFAPQHSDQRPIVDFPLKFSAVNRAEENINLGSSTII